MKIKIICEKDEIVANAIKIMNRHLQQRGCEEFLEVNLSENAETDITLKIDTELSQEEFRIDVIDFDFLVITGGSSRGLLYGIGKMLRNASYSGGGFKFTTWQGQSSPAKSLRMLYLASHFHNYYHVAPMSEIIEYIQDNALRGYNAIALWVDKHHYTGADDPEYIKFVARTREIYIAGENVGMEPIYAALGNEGYSTTPEHLKATYTGRSFYGVEVCPSTEEGVELILKNLEDTLKLFSGVTFGYLSIWSYDQGGCACERCSPWGGNGMVKCGQALMSLLKKYYPNIKSIYSTWLFDNDDWKTLDKKLENKEEPWLDYIIADSHSEFPKYPLENGVPGGRPMLNFPEISMWCMFPWGSLGANPLIKRFRRLWGQVCNYCDGGEPYSEGIYEDINQALYGDFYWNGNNETEQFTKEYFNFEMGGGDCQEFKKALNILEQNHISIFQPIALRTQEEIDKMLKEGRKRLKSRELIAYKEFHGDPHEALEILLDIDKKLPNWGKDSWRWRIILLRGIIDVELKENDLEISDKCEKAFEELAELFYSNGIAEYKVAPLTRESIDAVRSSQKKV